MARPGTTPALPGKAGYIPGIDGLRACAALLVVAFHARVIPGGFIGVDVFFVLSAFLITRILQREWSETGAIELKRFYGRRLKRLGPAFAFMLAGYVMLAPLVWPGHPHLTDALLAALYVSDYSYALIGAPLYLQHTWSLAVEEQFYLLWPLLLPVLLRSRQPVVWLAAAYLAVVCWRASFGDDWRQYYYRADTRATGLIIGAALALVLDRLRLTQWHAAAGMLAIALAATLGQFGSDAALAMPLAELGAVLVVGAAAQRRLGALGAGLSLPVMITLGQWSYGIYLWHYPITVALRPVLSGWALFGAVIVPSVLLAWLSFVTVERLPDLMAQRRKTPLPHAPLAASTDPPP
jgi:peptidoglycan/LPS O-acetylase OafA/YrhL